MGQPDTEPLASERTDPVSFVTLSWLSNLILTGAKRPLQQSDIPLLPETSQSDNVAHVLDPFNARLKEFLKNKSSTVPDTSEKKKTGPPPPSYFLDIMRSIFVPYVFSVLLDMSYTFIETVLPVFQAAILNYLQSGNSQFFITSPGALAFTYFFMSFGSLIFSQIAQQLFRRMRFNLRSTLTSAVYAKSLKLSHAASAEFSKGRVIQMINVDVEVISTAIASTHHVLTTPFQVGFSVYYLVRLFGKGLYPVGIEFGIFALMAPAVLVLVVSARRKYMTVGDQRLKIVREVLEGMKLIKLRGQESHFQKIIARARQSQLSAMWAFFAGFLLFVILILSVPYASMIGTFIVYARTVAVLDPAVIFPAVSYFMGVFEPMQALPQVFMALASASISWNRVRAFLVAEESDFRTEPVQDGKGYAVQVSGGTFRWEAAVADSNGKSGGKEKSKKSRKAKDTDDVKVNVPETAAPVELFKGLDVSIEAGKLIAIVGPVGSGKSSFLSAITGEMTRVEGKVSIFGKVALCQQQTWLMSMSVRENILFGRESNSNDARLEEVVRVCGLEVDIQQLQNGLETQVGEKGITLSGGQKARVGLARAVYNDADIYLLDDPLAALDAHVGKHVFEECIVKSLAGKTRLLVTHQLHVLPHVDHILVFDKGVLVEQGTYDQLVNQNPNDGSLKEMMKHHAKESNESQTSDNKKPVTTPGLVAASKESEKAKSATPAALIQEEDRQVGAVDKKYLVSYFREGAGFLVAGLAVLMALSYSACTFGSVLWMAFWSQDTYSNTTRFGLSLDQYVNVYTVIIALNFCTAALMTGFIQFTAFKSAKSYHQKAFIGLFCAPMSFFDSQPLGRILNRMTKDIESIDLQLFNQLLNLLLGSSMGLALLANVVYATYYTLIFVVFLAVLFFYLSRIYRSNIREIKRLVAIQKSPLTAYISECIGGAITIRTFQADSRTVHHQRQLMDRSIAPEWTLENVLNWFSFRLRMAFSGVTLFVVLYAGFGHLDAAIVGLALTSVDSLGMMFFGTIRQLADAEASFVAVERVDHYVRELPREAEYALETDPEEGIWPSRGDISISRLQVKYSSTAEPVIEDLSLEIKGGEKIGVVGRTGSGKSTLLTALFRIVEPSNGTITIDGLDVSKLGLHTLRSRLQIIPQDPVLFSGTLRQNLDVEGRFTDQEIWDALGLVGMKEYVSGLEEKLEAPVSERGDNFSVGQRQLLTLASAICCKPKILVMDEASSSVDQAADSLIQAVVRDRFRDATVISIAHRVNSVADFDRILVLDAGKMAEFDTPAALLRNPDSIFKSLVVATGAANAGLVEEIANNHV